MACRHRSEYSSSTANVENILDAVEPIIRADERERHGNNCGGMWDEWTHDLRAKVEALPSLQMRRLDDVYDWYVLRADVLALFDGPGE